MCRSCWSFLHGLGLYRHPRGKRERVVFTCLCACVLTVHVCPVRGQRLKEVLQLHEFRRESSELDDWMNQQRQTAESQDLGNDYQHVQVIPC